MDKWEIERFTLHGREFIVYHSPDDTGDTPWGREDGHGPVSDWRPKDSKRPGGMVLNEDRGFCRFYDFAAAVKLARKEGWDTEPYKQGTPGERAHRAAMADYQRLRDWCHDGWCYIGVIVYCGREHTSLWGIESDCDDYLAEVARDLAGELAHDMDKADRTALLARAFT